MRKSRGFIVSGRSVYWALFIIALGAGSASRADDRGVVGDLERTASATPQEKLQYAADANNEQRAAVAQVEKLADDARREGETERVDCVTARLTEIRALAQVTEASQVAMNGFLASGQRERSEHEMRKIAVALGKTRQLVAEAQGCFDDGTTAAGDTTVRVEGGLTGDVDETAPIPLDVLDQGFDPPQQSPFN